MKVGRRRGKRDSDQDAPMSAVTQLRAWLERKMEVPEAFRAAQNEMRKRYDNPFFWAGFVLME